MGDYNKLEDKEGDSHKKGYSLSPEIEAETQTGPEGLTKKEAARRLERDG